MKEKQKKNLTFQVISNKLAIIMNMNELNTLLKIRDFFLGKKNASYQVIPNKSVVIKNVNKHRFFVIRKNFLEIDQMLCNKYEY